MKRIKSTIFVVISIFTVALTGTSCTQQEDLKALILTGQNNHNWQSSSIRLKMILENAGVFSVDMKISPGRDEDMSGFIVDFSPYDVVVLNYNGAEWPSKTKEKFVTYVENGGGVVIYHAANNSFPNWKEYNEMTGLGGWEGRDENWGPYIYIENGEVIRDDSPGSGGRHGDQHEFVMEAFKPDHPIMMGLPEKWKHTKDELYSKMRGPAKNMEILAYACDDKKFNGTGRNEPLLLTISYGEGRIFHTMLGNVGGEVYPPALECAGFITTLQRGAEWAATGKVTQKVPENFPTEDESMSWEFYRDINGDIRPFVEEMRSYEIGKSDAAFNIMDHLMKESKDDPQKIDKYHIIIKKLLESEKSTDECKKVLCKELSWIADDSYLKIYEVLKKNPDLTDEAQYALDVTGK
jgi:uncharacterized protein